MKSKRVFFLKVISIAFSIMMFSCGVSGNLDLDFSDNVPPIPLHLQGHLHHLHLHSPRLHALG